MGATRTDAVATIWRVLVTGGAIDRAVLAAAQRWGMVAFAWAFAVVLGSLSWRARAGIRPFLSRLGLDNFAGFMLLAIGVSAMEEIICRAFGNSIANPILWADLAQVCLNWAFWFEGLVSDPGEEIRLFGDRGFAARCKRRDPHEGVSSGLVLASPILVAAMAPLVVVVYAAVFVLPLQLIDRTGTDTSRWRYPAAVVLPYIGSLPVGAASDRSTVST